MKGGNLVFTFTLSESTCEKDVVLNISLNDQTATLADSDYSALSSSVVTIPSGSTSFDLMIPSTDDLIVESDERVELVIDSADGTTIDTSPFSVTLTDGGAVALSAEPSTKTIRIGESWKVSGVGGSAPYSYAVISGAGSVDANGIYTAPQTPTTAVVEITDNVGATIQSTITVNQNYSDAGACNGFGFYSSDLGNIKDPGGDSNYAASTSCTVYIYSSSGQNIDLNFNSLSLGAGDTLTIRPSGGTAINYDENSTLPTGTVQTGASYIVLEFNSDASGESTGFDIDWEADYLALKLSTFSPSLTIEAEVGVINYG